MAVDKDAITFEPVGGSEGVKVNSTLAVKVKLTQGDIGAKRQDNFVAWNCPFDECRTPKR
ncbi:hypothetical protein [Stigmatella aurantiaca]|uniref:Uncharacterized protein n=1 Tax=Stigmatella aurantiaca (strain DW4/3-1) TaxID=378806 RepID=Q090Z6_STIAD|nr:hypothetical protein [Stigmatella aurantiaca]EAU66282.1 hypothetical protein STIAU_2540 [Stigmatella aurantiaca DW4/3-1]